MLNGIGDLVVLLVVLDWNAPQSIYQRLQEKFSPIVLNPQLGFLLGI